MISRRARRSKSTRVLGSKSPGGASLKALKPLQLAPPEALTPPAPRPRPSFANPFAAGQAQAALNPWEDSVSASPRPLRQSGAQRGSSAALDMLRASPSDHGEPTSAPACPAASVSSDARVSVQQC